MRVPWPVIAAKGKARVAWSSLIATPLATMEAFNPLRGQSCGSRQAFELIKRDLIGFCHARASQNVRSPMYLAAVGSAVSAVQGLMSRFLKNSFG